MNVLAIIPARAGSKGIAHKNTAMLAGRPLIDFTIDCALDSRKITNLIVSTNCQLVVARARCFGVDVGRRPEWLALDDTPMIAVLQWHLQKQEHEPDAILCLQPTCPLRLASDIDGAIKLMDETGCSSVVSYSSVGACHPARMAIVRDGRPMYVGTSDERFRDRQKLEPYFIRSGDIYLARTELVRQGMLMDDDCRAWVIPSERHVNIDTPMDLLLAETLIERTLGARRSGQPAAI